MNLTEQLSCVMRKGAKPHVFAVLLESPGMWENLTALRLSKLVPFSTSAIRRACDDMVLGNLIQCDTAQPRSYYITEAKALHWHALLKRNPST